MTTEEAIVDVFERRAASALFVTEVQYGMVPRCDAGDFAAALSHLVENGTVIVVSKQAPDVHLSASDLRIVARSLPGASDAIEATWRNFLREFLSSHRCS
jgi:hypothetical protein